MSTSTSRTAIQTSTSSFDNNVKKLTEKTNKLISNVSETVRRLPAVLTEKQIKCLQEHKYASEGITLLDPYMQKFWNWLIEYCPLWVAPNLLTLIGLALNIATSVLLIILTDGAKEQCTRWMYFFTALSLFLYQSLDAIDGKQARRTNSSSPLGELFDHGCDTVSAVLITVACCCAVQLGIHPWLMFWFCVSSYIALYCLHWQTYVTGILRFGKVDFTEGEIACIVIHMISSIRPGFWATTIPIINVECRVSVGLVLTGIALWNIANNIHTILENGRGRNFSIVADPHVIVPIWHIGFLTFLAFIASNSSISHALKEHTALHLVFYGIAFSKIMNRIIVAYMSKSSLNAWDTAYISPIAVCINQYFNCCIDEHIFLWLFFFYSLYDLLRYNVKVCQELCDALDLHCFRIRPPTAPKMDHLH